MLVIAYTDASICYIGGRYPLENLTVKKSKGCLVSRRQQRYSVGLRKAVKPAGGVYIRSRDVELFKLAISLSM